MPERTRAICQTSLLSVGHTRLRIADLVGSSASEVAKLLQEVAADAVSNVPSNWTSLHVASWAGHDKIAIQLLAAGADQDEAAGTHAAGPVPLSFAARGKGEGHEKVVRALLAVGADVNKTSNNGQNPANGAVLPAPWPAPRAGAQAGP